MDRSRGREGQGEGADAGEQVDNPLSSGDRFLDKPKHFGLRLATRLQETARRRCDDRCANTQGRGDAFNLDRSIDRKPRQTHCLRRLRGHPPCVRRHALRRTRQRDIETALGLGCGYRQCIPHRRDACRQRRKLRDQFDKCGRQDGAVLDADNVMATPAVKPDDDILARPVRCKDGAAARGWRNPHNLSHCRVDALKGKRRRNEVSLKLQVTIERKVLQRTTAAFTIMAAARRHSIRGRRDDRHNTCAIALDFGFDHLAWQRKRHEDLTAFMFGDAIALRAKAQDRQCRSRLCHRGASSSFRLC